MIARDAFFDIFHFDIVSSFNQRLTQLLCSTETSLTSDITSTIIEYISLEKQIASYKGDFLQGVRIEVGKRIFKSLVNTYAFLISDARLPPLYGSFGNKMAQ